MGIIPCTTDDLIVGVYNICLDGIDLGATTGGVTITQSNTYNDVRNDQTTLLQARHKSAQDWKITTTMRSLTLDKMRVLFGVKDGLNAGGDTLCFSDVVDGCSFPEEFQLVISGPGPGCGCRNFQFPRVVITPDELAYTINIDSPVELAVEFTALASCPEGFIGCVTDTCDMIATDEDTLEALICIESFIPNYVAPV